MHQSHAVEPAWYCAQDSSQQWYCSATAPGNQHATTAINTNTLLPVPAIKDKTEKKQSSPASTISTSTLTFIPDFPFTCPNTQALQAAPENPPANDDVIRIFSESAFAPDHQHIEFMDQVSIHRNQQIIQADKIFYNDPDKSVDARGNVIFYTPGVKLFGQQANYLLEKETGTLQNAAYQLQRPARGTANTIQHNKETLTLQEANYTTCPEGNNDWLLSARSLLLDKTSNQGKGKHVVLKFKNIPVAYTPYVQFPLSDKRTSGFLIPQFGHSDDLGVDLAFPYYWNIAPNQDASLTPRYLSERGLLLGIEHRFLTSIQEGASYGEYIYDTDLDQNRGLFSIQHQSGFAPGWSSHINYNYVSDDNYLNDFGDNLRARSTTHLLREGSVRYQGSFWDATTRLAGYQDLRGDEPYDRLPQFLLNSAFSDPLNFHYQMQSEWVYFDKDNDVTGSRLNLQPSISYPFQTAWLFVTPKVAFDYTRYDLKQDEQQLPDDSPSRSIPIVSLDSGIFLERQMSLANTAFVHSLEPRLFYLYAEDKNQDDIPLFDTGNFDFSYSQLFRENRFTGKDRFGDANQLTFALTNRLLERNTGVERLRASLGQIFYFDDRNVQLDANSPTEQNNTSSIVAELHSRWSDRWNGRYAIYWNPDESKTEYSAARLQFRADKKHILNMDYRYREEEQLEQTDLSSYWKFAQNWTLIGRWNYSLTEDFTLEALAGIEYDSCCWALRLLSRIEQEDVLAEDDLSFLLEFQFKGLGSLGNKTGKLLEQDILGYKDSGK